jgi:hypothetical protein
MSLWTGWKSKPPQGTPLDPTHGLCQGLQGFYPCNEGSGGIANDVVAGVNLFAAGWGSTSPWLQAPGVGVGVNDSLAGANILGTLPASKQFGWPQSIAGGVTVLSAPTANATFFGLLPNNTNAIPRISLGIYFSSPDFQLGLASGSSFEDFPIAAAFSGGTYTVGASVTANGFSAYAGGVSVSTQSGGFPFPISPPAWTSSAQAGTGDTIANNRSAASVITWWGWWNRVLSAAEHAALASNPWQMFAPPIPFWFGTSSGGGTTFEPAWCPRSTVVGVGTY